MTLGIVQVENQIYRPISREMMHLVVSVRSFVCLFSEAQRSILGARLCRLQQRAIRVITSNNNNYHAFRNWGTSPLCYITRVLIALDRSVRGVPCVYCETETFVQPGWSVPSAMCYVFVCVSVIRGFIRIVEQKRLLGHMLW